MNTKTFSENEGQPMRTRINPATHTERRAWAGFLTGAAAAFAAVAGFPLAGAGIGVGGLLGVARSTGQDVKKLAKRTIAGAVIGGALVQGLSLAWNTGVQSPPAASPSAAAASTAAPVDIGRCREAADVPDISGRRLTPGFEMVPCDQIEGKPVTLGEELQIYPAPAASQ